MFIRARRLERVRLDDKGVERADSVASQRPKGGKILLVEIEMIYTWCYYYYNAISISRIYWTTKNVPGVWFIPGRTVMDSSDLAFEQSPQYDKRRVIFLQKVLRKRFPDNTYKKKFSDEFKQRRKLDTVFTCHSQGGYLATGGSKKLKSMPLFCLQTVATSS